jgi:tetratricopeptide (TPR) repeat protein/serine/threonine protein kinase
MAADFQREYLLRLPLPLAQLYSRAHNAKDARGRHDNAFYLCEALVKLAGAPAVACYVQETQQGQPRAEALDRLLLQLALPSLGQWLAILRELSRHFGTRVDADRHPLGRLHEQLNRPRKDLAGALALYRRIKNGPDGAAAGDQSCSVMQVLEALVQYRNQVFGHGGPRFDSFFEKEMGPLLLPAVNDLLAEDVVDWLGPPGTRLAYLTEVRAVDAAQAEVGVRELVGRDSERAAPLRLPAEAAGALLPNRVAVLWPGRAVPLRLDPLLVYRETDQGEDVLFLNRDRNSRQVEYLSYFSGKTEREASMAPALAALLSQASGRAVTEERLAEFRAQSLAATPTFDVLTAEQPPAGRVLGDHELLGVLGRGGMGVVYLARQTSLGRLVALKTLPADLGGDEVALARLRREIRALGRCDHPHIVKILTSGVLPDAQPYYTMEYVPGCDLERVWQELSGAGGSAAALSGSSWRRAVLTASKKQRDQALSAPADAPAAKLPLPPLPDLPPQEDDPGGYVRRVVTLLRDAARAVQAVHEQNLIHRDVKPANLMLTPDGGRVVLMDFGLAKGYTVSRALSTGGGLLGTLRYAAPEQLAAATLKVGPEADVRGLGVTLWELLTRRRLFAEAGDEKQLAQMIHDNDVPRLRSVEPALDRDLQAIVARATERRVGDRIASARQLAEYLDLWLDGRPLPIRTPSVGELLRRWVRRRKGQVAAGVTLALMTLAAAFGFWMWSKAEDKRQADRRKGEETQRLERHAAAEKLRVNAEVVEELAKSRLRAGRFADARDLVRQAVKHVEDAQEIENSPELEGARLRLGKMFARTDLLVTFYRSLDQTELLGGISFRSADTAVSGKRSLELLGVFTKAEWWNDLPDDDLTPAQQAHLREDVYLEIILVAGVQAREAVFSYGTPEVEPPLRAALETLGAAKKFRREHGVLALEAIFRAGLGQLPSLDTYLDRGPVRPVDHYLNGITHLWVSMASESSTVEAPLTRAASLLLPGTDFKNPRAMAEYRLRTAAQMDPEHYWSHFWLGRTLMASGKLQEAELAFNACLTLRPDYGVGYIARAEALLAQADKASDPRAAKLLRTQGDADLQTAVRVSPTVEAFEERAIHYLQLADEKRGPKERERYLKLALADVDEVVRLDPTAPWAFGLRARLHRDLGDHPHALADVNEAVRLDPTNPDHLNFKGVEHFRAEEYDQAGAVYDELVRLHPGKALYWINRGHTRIRQGKFEGAVADFTEAIRLDPKNHQTIADRGWVYFDTGDFDRAIKDFTEAIRLDRSRAPYHNGKGLAHKSKGEYDRAIAEYAEAIRLDPGNAVYYGNLGECHHLKRDWDATIADMTTALDAGHKLANGLVPRQHAFCRTTRGLAYSEKGLDDLALADFMEAVRLEGTNADYHCHLGNTYFRKADYDAAIKEFTTAIDLVHDTNSYYRENRGNSYLAQQKYGPALDDLSRAIALNGDLPGHWVTRANTYARLGQRGKALADYSQAIKLDPKDAGLWNLRAVQYAMSGRREEAIDDCSKAIELKPDVAIFWRNRGSLRAQGGKWDDALTDLRRAAELAPTEAQYWSEYCLALLERGDKEGHEKACSEMVKHFGKPDSAAPAATVVIAVLRAPGQTSDLDRLRELTELVAAKHADSRIKARCSGLLEYRLGNYEAAGRRFQEATKAGGNGGEAFDWFFLAMAQHHCKEAEEAKKSMETADRLLEGFRTRIQKSGDHSTPPFWQERELELIRKEAEALLKSSP